jgi:hypothetical protein
MQNMDEKLKKCRDLKVCQMCYNLEFEIYRTFKQFIMEEIFDLKFIIRSTAFFISANNLTLLGIIVKSSEINIDHQTILLNSNY